MKDFTVVSSTATSKGNFCTKVQNTTEVKVSTAFGEAISQTRETYYFFTQSAPTIGMTAPLDLNAFDRKDKAFTTPEGDDIVLKYLYPKRG
jgi:hypothetical protein